MNHRPKSPTARQLQSKLKRFVRPTYIFAFLFTPLCFFGASVWCHAQGAQPFSKEGLLTAVRSKKFSPEAIAEVVQIRGVGFQMTPATEEQFSAAGASAKLIAIVRDNYRAAGGTTSSTDDVRRTANNKTRHPALGLEVQEVTAYLAPSLGLPAPHGVLVNTVYPQSLGAAAGLKPRDVITSFNGVRIDGINTLRAQIGRLNLGNDVPLMILRDRREQQLNLSFAANANTTKDAPNASDDRAGKSNRGRLGMRVEPLTANAAARYGIKNDARGLLVTDVEAAGAAAEAGIQAGDVIEQINGQTVADIGAAQSALGKTNGDAAKISLNRRGKTLQLTLRPH